MDKERFSVEGFLGNWNDYYPQNSLTIEDLKNPHAVMDRIFLIFNKLGIDRDFLLAPPEDSNESQQYYWDLLPVIKLTRVVNHLVSVMHKVKFRVCIINFLQPTPNTSRSILMLLFNLILFKEDRHREILPIEEALFAKTEHVNTLESRKNKLLEMLNKQAEEKGKRAERLEKLRGDVKQFEEELKQEKEMHNEEKQELEPLLKESQQAEMLLEQKKSNRDTLVAEVARKKALRVYDAEDIKAQAAHAARSVQEAEDKLDTLRSTLMQKENSLKNLQTIKPSLDTANNYLHEIMKLSESLKDSESGDLESDSVEGELEVLNTELSELRVQLSELQAARAEAAEKHQESQAKRQTDKSQAQRALREAEERDRKCRERVKRAAHRTEEIKRNTLQYVQDKSAAFDQLQNIQDSFCEHLKSVEDLLIKKIQEVEKRVEEKLNNRHL